MYELSPSDYVDPVVGARIVDLSFSWKFGHDESLELLYGKVKRRSREYNRISNGSYENRSSSLYMSRALELKPKDIVSMKYAIYHVAKVNDELIEFPILLPVENNYPIGYNSCDSARALLGEYEYRSICFAWAGGTKGTRFGRKEFRHVGGRSSKINMDSFAFRFGLDEDVKIETYFEIREFKTGKSLYTLNKKA
jgi:hypothetical protein